MVQIAPRFVQLLVATAFALSATAAPSTNPVADAILNIHNEGTTFSNAVQDYRFWSLTGGTDLILRGMSVISALTDGVREVTKAPAPSLEEATAIVERGEAITTVISTGLKRVIDKKATFALILFVDPLKLAARVVRVTCAGGEVFQAAVVAHVAVHPSLKDRIEASAKAHTALCATAQTEFPM